MNDYRSISIDMPDDDVIKRVVSKYHGDAYDIYPTQPGVKYAWLYRAMWYMVQKIDE